MKTVLTLAALITATLALPAAAQTATPTPAPASSPCAGAEARQFDFWVGHWDVYPNGKPKLVAHSVIESLYGGCAIRENWQPLSPGDGGSLSSYVTAEKGWRQTWVDASGARVDFKGGWDGRAMVLTGWWTDVLGPGRSALIRMTYSRAADGSVRQLGEASTDGGKTWALNFDFIYRPASGVTPLG